MSQLCHHGDVSGSSGILHASFLSSRLEMNALKVTAFLVLIIAHQSYGHSTCSPPCYKVKACFGSGK